MSSSSIPQSNHYSYSPTSGRDRVDHSTGFPFNFSRSAYAAELEYIPTRDLMAEIESSEWLALKVADNLDDSRACCELQLEAMVEELERRHRLLKARARDPLRPAWPQDTDRFRQRIDAVKAAWPMVRFARELLLLDLTPAGDGKFKARCPLPGHPDKTPSFYLYPDNWAHCHGCHRGGDVIKLAQYTLNLDRFTDALRRLEQEGGVR